MKFRDRIIGTVRVWGNRATHHPKNWRVHDEFQQSVIEGTLQDIGIAGSGKAVPEDPSLIAEALALKTRAERQAWAERFEASGARILILDGHLRETKIREQPAPYELLDLNEHEQAQFIATFDPIGDLARMDRDKFVDLAADFNSTNAAVQALVADLAALKTNAGDFGLEGDGATGGSGPDADVGDGAPGPEPAPPRVSLAERFGVPPFSVLNAREGWWQARKAAWIGLGIASEIGRGGQAGAKLTMSETVQALKPSADQAAKRARGGATPNASPGGSPRPAMTLKNGKTLRGDGHGRALE